MWRKIIDYYRLYYLNDLFEIKQIFYGLSSMVHLYEFVWTLRSSVLVVFNIFSLQTQQIEVRLVAIKSAFFYRIKPIPSFIFRNTPFKLKFSENENCKQGEEFRSKKIHVRSKDPSKIARQFENGSKEKEKGPRKVKRTFYAKVESPPLPPSSPNFLTFSLFFHKRIESLQQTQQFSNRYFLAT